MELDELYNISKIKDGMYSGKKVIALRKIAKKSIKLAFQIRILRQKLGRHIFSGPFWPLERQKLRLV